MTFKNFDLKNGKTFLIVAGLLIWSLIISSFFVNGYLETWMLWQVPAKMPLFLDFRLIPASAETFRTELGFCHEAQSSRTD